MFLIKYFVAMSIFVIIVSSKELEKNNKITIKSESKTSTKQLIRRKRYLIFPEGSSLQLVFCLTMPILGMSSIFTIGGTASLAWQLPHEPYKFHRKAADEADKKIDKLDNPIISNWTYAKPENRISGNKFSDENFFRNNPPKIFYSSIKTPFSEINVKMQKRKYYPYKDSPSTLYQIDLRENKLPSYIYDRNHYMYHRRTKRELYSLIEKFFAAQRKHGKACLLKAICEISQAAESNTQGTFVEEILKAIFSSKIFDTEFEDEYDEAFNKYHDCTNMYPECSQSVWNVF